MSNLLSQASLVMIPSGYKEDVVYSQIPTNGNGDLSFTRASNGTRINSAGLVEDCPWNLCEYSEDQTQWTSQNATTVTANSTTAPNGTLTADTVTPTATNDDHYRGIGLSSQVGELTAFIYVKPNGYNFFDWGIWNGSQYIVRATFDLVNLTYTFTNAGTATIESVGNGWLKCGISGTNASLSSIQLYYRIRPTGGTGAFTGDGTSGAFIWGGQLNIGSTAKPYFPTTDRLNVPRLTYQNGGGGCPSLLLEKQSTNHILYSEDYSQTAWTKTGTAITTNSIISPDGTQNADLMTTNDAAGSVYRIYEGNSAGSDAVCTTSVYFKYGNWQYVYILGDNYLGQARYAIFDLINITNTFVSSGYTATITSVGDGWYKCTFTGEMKSNTYNQFGLAPYDNTYSGFSIANGKTLYIWGTQREQSSYATSYIPTTSSSVTRVADACSKTGISSLIGQTEGTIFVDINNQLVNPPLDTRIQLSDGSTNNWIFLGVPDGGTGGLVRCYVLNVATSFNMSFYSSSALAEQRYKIAFAYKSGSFALYINGVLEGSSSATGTMPSCSALAIGGSTPTSITQDSIQQFNEVILFPTRLTNAELASLTTI